MLVIFTRVELRKDENSGGLGQLVLLGRDSEGKLLETRHFCVARRGCRVTRPMYYGVIGSASTEREI